MFFISSKKLFLFLRYLMFCYFSSFLSRFQIKKIKDGPDQKMNFPKHVRKLKKIVRDLVFTAGSLHTFSIKVFLVKCPIKRSSFNNWEEWSSGLRY